MVASIGIELAPPLTRHCELTRILSRSHKKIDRPMLYLWTKTLHILFVMAWMAALFYLPRILVNLAEAGDQPQVRERLLLMGRRLYGFGHVMFGVMMLFGLFLWMHFRIGGGWVHAKITLVFLLLAYYIATGRYLKRAAAGGKLPSATFFRWFNEAPLALAIPIIYLVVGKPF